MAANTISFKAEGFTSGSSIAEVELAERGLPIASIAHLRELGLTFTEIAGIVISPRTLKHRVAREENLSAAETERVIRVRRIVALADRVFGNHEKAMRWLRGPDDRLNGRTALDVLRTEPGGRVVEGMLWGIDEGVYS